MSLTLPTVSLLTEAKGSTEKSWLWIVTLEASACCHSFKIHLRAAGIERAFCSSGFALKGVMHTLAICCKCILHDTA